MPISLADVMTRFSTEDRCRELLRRLRWPSGVECPRCKMPAVELETDKELFYCKDCDYQFTVTAGSIFNDSHLPLTKWFMATLLLCEAKKGMSACQIQRTLGLGSYKTAWYLCHRIRAAMVESQKPMLSGKVEMDETYVGGKNWWQGKGARLDNKEIVIGLRQRGGDLRFFHAKDVKSGTLENYIRENISEDVDILFTDDFNAYRSAAKHLRKDGRHKTIRHKLRIYAKGDVYTNTVESAFSLLKRGIVGTWHKVSAKHLQAYCEEMTFRFNRRDKSDLFLDTLRHMVTAPVLTFEKLTA
ncbi:MAG TPA: IS1595 family transposase [Candidatus Acidoferrum sp.]|nr:IS1595 family transposase [Candidatus Acidoferrum sp.]